MVIALAASAIAVLGALTVVQVARRRAAQAPPDPFLVLDLQLRLARLAAEVRRIDADRTMLARAHHLRVALEAYDALLSEACALAAGTPREALPLGTVSTDTTRLDRELLLSARGWSW